ncbi:Alpha/Beta hydrolase protein [Mrakia frigida]|uniref:S10 family peptidase n=1 Tax=Mrakia frigida TaxID=29902 RepID=UPI003FCC1448
MLFSTALLGLLALSSSAQAAFKRSHQASFFAGGEEVKLDQIRGGDVHTELYHDQFPDHRVRIKETTGWCDPDVKSFTGYLDVDSHGKELFFYFFLSRSEPEKDDVLMWINGGPGCSSATGLFMELGPCSVTNASLGIDGTKPNPYSWNNKLNTFFLDQPTGVGLSYSKNGQTVSNTEQASVDVQAFLSIFFETFKEFEGRGLHLSGESYGGRYLPIFGAAVVDGNKFLKHPINLKSVIIGNGVTDRFDLTLSHYKQVCTSLSGLPPVLSVLDCATMQESLPRCEAMMKAECEDRFDALGCQAALDFCYKKIRSPFTATGLNPYDISKPCDGYLCYGDVSNGISAYLDLPSVRSHLGIHSSVPPFVGCSSAVGSAFNAQMDGTGKTYLYVASLLEHGVKVLIYAGKYDFQCNWIHQLSWTSKLEWSGSVPFNAEPIEEWFVSKNSTEAAGEWRSSGGLTYVTVRGAGHMVPYDKPVDSLEMLTRFLENDGKMSD